MASHIPQKAHYGGHLGLIGLLGMLTLTGCIAASQTLDTGAGWLPAWAQQTSGNTQAPVLKPAQAVTEATMKAVYIVRFDANRALSPVGQGFRKDPAASRATFAEWAKDYPALEGLKLIRASYSGELILGLPSDSARDSDGVLEALNRMDNLVYAERDVMADAGRTGADE